MGTSRLERMSVLRVFPTSLRLGRSGARLARRRPCDRAAPRRGAGAGAPARSAELGSFGASARRTRSNLRPRGSDFEPALAVLGFLLRSPAGSTNMQETWCLQDLFLKAKLLPAVPSRFAGAKSMRQGPPTAKRRTRKVFFKSEPPEGLLGTEVLDGPRCGPATGNEDLAIDPLSETLGPAHSAMPKQLRRSRDALSKDSDAANAVAVASPAHGAQRPRLGERSCASGHVRHNRGPREGHRTLEAPKLCTLGVG